NLDYETLEVLVVEIQHNGLFGVVHVVEHGAIVLVKGARDDDAWNLSAGHADSVPPATCLFGRDSYREDIRKRDIELTLDRPDLVPSLDIQPDVVAFDRNADHRDLPVHVGGCRPI